MPQLKFGCWKGTCTKGEGDPGKTKNGCSLPIIGVRKGLGSVCCWGAKGIKGVGGGPENMGVTGVITGLYTIIGAGELGKSLKGSTNCGWEGVEATEDGVAWIHKAQLVPSQNEGTINCGVLSRLRFGGLFCCGDGVCVSLLQL